MTKQPPQPPIGPQHLSLFALLAKATLEQRARDAETADLANRFRTLEVHSLAD